MSYVQSIPVVDGNGAGLTVYEFRDRRFLTKVRRYKLCSGEAVEPAEADTFRVIGSGEELLRMD
jgi:hypothetical protein